MALQTRQIIRPFDSESLEAIAKVLGDTTEGLTGSEINHLLANCSIPNTDPQLTKWKRIYNALANFQNRHSAGNHVIVFIQKAMSPALYTQDPILFEKRRESLNTVLALCGFSVRDDGKIIHVNKASNLDEAYERSDRMKAQLRKRNVHQDVMRFCDTEIIAKNNFHAVLEAMKSITSKVRSLSGLTSDGTDLVNAAFGLGKEKNPLLAINGLTTDTLQSEQRGFINLLNGLYGMIRNPLSHEAKIEWPMPEEDALDILTTISFVHRKLEKARRYRS